VNFGSGDYDSFTYDPNTGRMTQYMATITGSSAYGTMTWNANGSLYSVALTDPFNAGDLPAHLRRPGAGQPGQLRQR
jgi:hypothetical protein